MSGTSATSPAALGPSGDISRVRARFGLIAILLVAFGLRVVYVLQSRASPLFDEPQMDALYHVQWARAFARGSDFQPGPFFRAPLYPWFLGSLFHLFGDGLFLPRLVQAAIGTLSCALVYLIGARAFDRRTGLVAALLAATYWILIYFEGELLLPVLEVLTSLLAIWLALRVHERPGASRAALAGLALGVAAIVRPNVLVVAPLCAGWIAWIAGPSWRTRATAAASFVLALCVPILPLTAYNLFVGHDHVLISSQSGVNLYIGNNEHADGSSAIVPGVRSDWWGSYEDSIALAEADMGRKLKPSEVSDWYTHKSFEFWREKPARALALLGFKLRLFWTDWELGNNQDERFFALRFGPILRWLPIGFGVLAPLGVLGFLLAARRGRALFPLWIFVPAYTASVVAFFVCARYRVPVLPVLMVFAAHALFEIVDALRARRWWRFGLCAAFLAVAGALVQAVPKGVDRTQAKGLEILGALALQHQDPEAAIDWLQQSVEENPRFPLARTQLALALVAVGRHSEAELQLAEALKLAPDDIVALRTLADLQLTLKRVDAALATARRLAQLAPATPIAQDALGRAELQTADDLMARGGDAALVRTHLEAAEAAFARALSLSADTDSRFNAAFALGEVRTRLARDEAAVQAYETALAARPEPDPSGWFWQCARQMLSATTRLGRGSQARERALHIVREHAADPRGPVQLREFLPQ